MRRFQAANGLSVHGAAGPLVAIAGATKVLELEPGSRPDYEDNSPAQFVHTLRAAADGTIVR